MGAIFYNECDRFSETDDAPPENLIRQLKTEQADCCAQNQQWYKVDEPPSYFLLYHFHLKLERQRPQPHAPIEKQLQALNLVLHAS